MTTESAHVQTELEILRSQNEEYTNIIERLHIENY